MTRQSPDGQFQSIDNVEGASAAYMEQLQARYLARPEAANARWAEFFKALGDSESTVNEATRGPSWARKDWPRRSIDELTAALTGDWADLQEAGATADRISAEAVRQGVDLSDEQIRRAVLDSVRALMMIRAYRLRGHLIADLDPLGMREEKPHPELDPASYGFGDSDMDRPIFLDGVLGFTHASMTEILETVRRTYCGTFTLQYMHISDPEQARWLKERIEGYGNEITFTQKGRRAILNKLVEAEGFEKFCHVKFMGTKRFGIDGGESLIPAMEQIIKRGGALGVNDIIIGMSHRGRLNVLVNVMSKPYRAIFNEFHGGSFKPDDVQGSGDVKYHLGSSSDRSFDGNLVHLSLTANPSHLEAVNPVVLGKARAKQDQNGDQVNRTTALPLLLHGDASFPGQGVVAECLQLSGIKGHRAGGTIHIVVNNQIGFTTAPHHSRSSPYPTDLALMVEAPIFHVNGDDPEAVVHAAKIATEFRQKFHRDVVIDIFCYRRFGHNEGDEPMFTNPVMYKHIHGHKTTLDLYSEKLVGEGLISRDEIDGMKAAFQEKMEEEFQAADGYRPNKADWLDGRWKMIKPADLDHYQPSATCISSHTMEAIGKALVAVPEGFHLHRTIGRLLGRKKEMFETGQGFDWATAEAMAFGSLLLEGFPVRLSGQDSVRGTFSQRHSAFIDQEDETRYFPLNNIREGQAQFEAVDSMLSENAVLGFEYGYSLSSPNRLILWEAQFGDFANGAQVMFDQFISSAEAKWLRMSGLVVLLPHGYEGQGPEHSSARMERFLQLSAEANWVVANCSTPANYFHILRRQLHRDYRKPLILMTPKSLLRHPLCVSAAADFSEGSVYHRILWDNADEAGYEFKLRPDNQISRVVLCSGKVYYDLLAERNHRGLDQIYLLRLEQLYPVPVAALRNELARFPNAEIVWCQEESKNQGAWTFVQRALETILTRFRGERTVVKYVGRAASASPAAGLADAHKAQQAKLVDRALSL